MVGVASKVTKLLTMGLDKRKSEKARYIFCHNLSDLSIYKKSLDGMYVSLMIRNF